MLLSLYGIQIQLAKVSLPWYIKMLILQMNIEKYNYPNV